MARFVNRFLHLEEAPGNVDDYRLFRMEGEERLSEPFSFDLTIRSQGTVPPAQAWIGAPVTFTFGNADNSERRVNGRCADFRHLHEKGRYTEFQVRVSAAFEALKLTRDRRIFNDLSNKQVIEQVLGEHQVAFDDAKYGPSAHKAYIVQHDESDFALVSRLMEDEGVFYYFKYDEGAVPFKHRMVLAGDPSGYYDGAPFDLAFRRDHMERGLHDLQMHYAGAPAKVVTHDYNFRQPGELTPVTSPSRVDWAEKKGQVFRYAAGYQDPGRGQERADLAAQGTESDAVTMRGQGTYSAFAPGARFNVPDERLQPVERRIVVRGVRHAAFDPYAGDEGEPFYRQDFEAHPSAQTFRPPRATPAPQPNGPQTATVLDQNDPEGLGRVKVRFHWDHTGHSTCWVRVLQQWAGDGAVGAQWIPRPGTEVLVGFIENRVDLPYLLGSFYNGKQKPVFDLPANLPRSGWQTTGPGKLSHHLYFDDRGGGEKVDVHSGKDFVRSADRDDTAYAKRHQEIWAKGIDVAGGESIAIHVGRSRIVVTDAGVWIDAPTINLNGGTAPATFAPTLQPPAPTAVPTGGGGPAPAPGAQGSGDKASAGGAGGAGAATHGGGAAAAPVGGGAPSPTQAALARKLVKPGGTGTQADADAVAGQLQKMPESALRRMDDKGVKVVATRGSVTSYASGLAGQQPRGWLPGSKIDDLPGIFDGKHNTVVIATAGDAVNRYVPATGQGHGSANLVMHEATHAIDQNVPAALGSAGRDFQAARAGDLAVLSPYELQAGKAGLSETYAESAARYFGGSGGSSNTPSLDRYWATHPLGGK